MKLTILGSGTVVPDGKRNSAGYFVEFPNARIMLDCGAGSVHALARYGIQWEELIHLFISHFHVDHVGELASLFFAFKHGMRRKRTEALTLIGPRGLEKVMQGLQQAFSPKLFDPGFPVNVVLLRPGETVAVAPNSSLTVAKTPHTPESLAVRIDANASLCYTGDTAYSKELSTFFKDADVLISECSLRVRRTGVRHLAIADAAKLARRSAARRLVVTHFYFDVDESKLREELRVGFDGEIIIGRDGLKIRL